MSESDDTQGTFRVYSAVPSETDSFWFEIGTAFPQQDGRGFSIVLRALPTSPQLLMRQCRDDGERALTYAQRIDAFEREIIERCLIASGGRISPVMEQLSIPRRTLSEKMARLGIDRRRFLQRAKDASEESAAHHDASSASRKSLHPSHTVFIGLPSAPAATVPARPRRARPRDR